MPIKLHCPMCGLWWSAPSLDELIKAANERWEKLNPPEDLMQQIRAKNNKPRLQQILEEKGYLEAPCTDCVTKLFVALARNKMHNL